MTRAIAVETARTGITCNAVCPGSVPTPAIMERIGRIAREQGRPVEAVAQDYAAERHPTWRFVAMEHGGARVAFLWGQAAGEGTGAAVPKGGGRAAGTGGGGE